MSTRSPRILLAGGGTGGHVYPAIAIADAVRELAPDAVIAFAGTEQRMEWEAVPKAGYEIHPITVSGFQRGLSSEALRRNLSFPFKLAQGMADAAGLVRGFDPDVAVGTGGYVSGPVLLAASLSGRPIVLQEQNAYAGATNKLLAKRAEVVFAAFEPAKAYFPDGKVELSGNPVRSDLGPASDELRAEALQHYTIPHEIDGAPPRVLLVMGGSLGAGPLNDAVEKDLQTLLADRRTFLVWQAGKRYYDAIRARLPQKDDAPGGVMDRVRLVAYLDRMDLAYAVADLAVCRAGALTCSELAVTGTPALLVPSPNVTADHQTKNAQALAEAGAARLLPEGRLAAELAQTAPPLLTTPYALTEMAEAALRIARPDAARTIAQRVLDLAARHQRSA